MIYEDEWIRVEREEHELPWVKIFSKKAYRELSDCDEATRNRLFEAMLATERAMLEFYRADKINIASFGNVCPQVHIHIIARFANDAYFPNSVWGERLRDFDARLPDFSEFCKRLVVVLG